MQSGPGLSLRLLSICDWITLLELQRYTVDTMPLISGSWETLALEYMSQMPSTIAADDFCSLHAKRAVCVPRHCTRDCVEESWPSATRFELLIGGIKWCIACCAVVCAGSWVMLIVVAREWSFSALLADDTELLCCSVSISISTSVSCELNIRLTRIQYGLPLAVALLYWIRHFSRFG